MSVSSDSGRSGSRSSSSSSRHKSHSSRSSTDDQSKSPPSSSSEPSPTKQGIFRFLPSFKRRRSRSAGEKCMPPRSRPVLSSQCCDIEPEMTVSPIVPLLFCSSLVPLRKLSSSGDSRFDFGSLDEEKIIPAFLGSRTCYDAMPKSGKVIVLSTELLVKNAFSCLVTNEIRAAPLWESATHTFVGVLTISDFINVLRHYYYSCREDIKSIENQKICTWRSKYVFDPAVQEITNVTKPIVRILPNDSLINAAKLLLQERIHRLPVYDEKRNSVLFVITRRGLLQYLFKNLLERMIQGHIKAPSYLKRTIGDLKSEIGTWENIATVSVNTRVIDALDIFCERNVSSLPVMDNDNKLVDIFAKFDVFGLAKEQTYDNLDMTISEALDKAEVHEDVYGCTLDESLGTVIDRFVAAKVHRLVVVDDKMCVRGMLSMSDILRYLILNHFAIEESSVVSDTIDEAPEGAAGGADDSSVFLESDSRASGSLQQSSSLEKQDSSDLSEEFVRLQVEGGSPESL